MRSNLVSELSKYRLIEEMSELDHYISMDSLFDKEQLPAVLSHIGERIGSPSHKVTASIITKRIAFYGVIHLYAMSVWNKRFKVELEEIKLIEKANDNLWLPDFYFGHYQLEDATSERKQWVDQVMNELFSSFFHPLIETLRNVTRFSKLVMWENISLYIFWLYESLLSDESYRDIYPRLRNDFQYIIHEACPELFGPYKNNPLSRFDSEKKVRIDSSEPIRIRKTCCLSNLLDGKEKKRCSTCPNGCDMPPF